ncbi:MAG: extracellular solute-binding protein [Ruthenibacterium sp.]
MKKLLSLALVIALTGTMLAGCGAKPAESAAPSAAAPAASSTAASTEPELSGSIVWATNRTDLADTVLADLANEFMALHPGTEIEVEGLKDVEQTLMTRMTANEMPDISLVINTKISSADYPTYFLPIDDLGFTKDDVYFYDNGLGPDGKLYNLCGCTYYNSIVYNKAAFRKAGIESTPKTIAELEEVCDKLVAAGITPFGTSYREKWPLRGFLSGFYTQIGLTGDPAYKNNLVNADKFFDDTKGGNLEVMELGRKWAKAGYFEKDLVNANWDNFRRDIAAGDIAMFYDGNWYTTQMQDAGVPAEDIGTFAFPELKTLTVTPDWFYGIAKNTKNPDLAKAFLKYMIEDGRYAAVMNLVSSEKGAKCTLPGFDELMSCGLEAVEVPATDPKLQEIFNQAQMDLDSIVQEYWIADDANAVVEKYNTKWAEAKQELAK